MIDAGELALLGLLVGGALYARRVPAMSNPAPEHPQGIITSPPKLEHFTASEFGEWWGQIDPALLLMLDEFRERLGVRVDVSPAEGAIGRHLGPDDTSRHNIDRWGLVHAVDVMPHGVDLADAYRVALAVGFTGIGLYPDWSPRPGLHLDNRADRLPGNPAKWSGVKVAGRQVLGDISRAFV